MKPSLRRILKDSLTKDYSCYVLITCGKPKGADGTMEVEMEYGGDLGDDPLVASYLVQGAQDQLEQEIMQES